MDLFSKMFCCLPKGWIDKKYKATTYIMNACNCDDAQEPIVLCCASGIGMQQ